MNLATRSARASASDRLAGCERTVAYTSSRPPIIVPCSIVSAPVLGFGVLRFGVWGLDFGFGVYGLGVGVSMKYRATGGSQRIAGPSFGSTQPADAPGDH